MRIFEEKKGERFCWERKRGSLQSMLEEMSLSQARAALEWQVELGATEAIGEEPCNRFEAPKVAPKPKEPLKAAPMVAQ